MNRSTSGERDSPEGHVLLDRSARFDYPGLLALIASLGENPESHRREIGRLAASLALPCFAVRLILLVEDKRFWIHPGTDPLALLRVLYMRVIRRGRRQGGSTIPEQLVKLRNKRVRQTVVRRLLRVVSALRLVYTEGRAQVLSEYLTSVYLGRNARGVAAAAKAYFNKEAPELSRAEAFFIAERIALPNRVRAARITNLLRRPAIRSAIGADIQVLPTTYQNCFGDAAARVVAQALEAAEQRSQCQLKELTRSVAEAP